jgi:subtilisin family serine protease
LTNLAQALEIFGLRPVLDRPVRVAIVDSGVYAGHPHVHGVVSGRSFVAGADPDDYIDRNGHGTAVAAAIREKVPSAALIAVKIFDRELRTTVDALARAIEWAAAQHVDLINLSLGTTNPEHATRLQEALEAARADGAAVVAAADQGGIPSLPGSLQPVVAVWVEWECPRDQVIIESADANVIRLMASPYPRPIPGVPPERNLRGASFAVANATGIIAAQLATSAGG